MNNEIKFNYCDEFEVVECGEMDIDVYDIEVEDNHNFFANNILIHNSVYLNIEPLIPAMATIYRPIIERVLSKKDGDVVNELNEHKFWENITDNFEKKSELFNKYFKPHDMLDGNGFIELCIKVEISKSDSKKFKEYCINNNLDFIFRRLGRDNTVHFLFLGGDVEEFKDKLVDIDINIISVIRTYPLDDFANTVIQDIIDNNYSTISKYLNAKNKMVMKRETICINGFWTGKKNYALNVLDNEGVIYAKPKVKITGINTSKNPKVVRDAIVEFTRLLLSVNNIYDTESLRLLNEFVTNFKNEFMKLSPEIVGKNVKVNFIETKMDINGMPVLGAPINSVGAIHFNRHIKMNNLVDYEYIKERDKMKYLYLTQPNPWNTHVIGYKDEGLPDDFVKYVDMNLMLEKDFYDMLDIILSSAGIELEYSRKNGDITSWLL